MRQADRTTEPVFWYAEGKPSKCNPKGEQMAASPEYVVLGGKQRTRVFQGDDAGSVVVGGSTRHYRDPLVIVERERKEKDQFDLIAEREARIKSGETSWCSHKDHEGDRELPASAFHKDACRATGRFPYCKVCRARMKRAQLEATAAAEGRIPRRLQRHQA